MLDKMICKKVIAGFVCMAIIISSVLFSPAQAHACGRMHVAAKDISIYTTACGGTDNVYVKENTTSFTIYVKGSNCAYIGKSGGVTGVAWLGYKTVKGTKYGTYKITIKKTKAPKEIGSVTLANGNKRIKFKLYSAKNLDF